MYIIPRPQQWYQKEGTFTLKYDRRIVLNSNCPPEVYEDAQMLQQDLEEYAGFCTTISCGIPENGDICLQLGEHMKEQEYTLLVQAHGICITGGSAVGIFYGIQTRCDKRKDSDDGLPEKAGRSHGILQTEPVTALYGAYLFVPGIF